MINKVILIGRVGAKPTIKESKSGTKYTSFSMVTDTGYGDEKVSDWHNITAFNKLAEIAEKYIDKGTLISVIGRLSYDTYEKDGRKQKSVKIIADELSILSGKQRVPEPAQEPQQPQPQADIPFVDDLPADDIPF